MTQKNHAQPGLSMAMAHLNAPYGAIVCADDLASSLALGELRASSAKASAILSYLFVEVEPRLVMQCAREAGSSLPKANQLYLSTVQGGAPRSALWETSVKDVL